MTVGERLRARFQEPVAALRQAGALEGQRIVDLGAGHGFFTVPAAMVVGPSGFVYAVEPDPKRCGVIGRKAASEGLGNVKVLKTGAEHLGEIPTATVDLVFSAFTLHHFVDMQAAMSETLRVLKDGGTFFAWDRVPGMLVRHGTRREDFDKLSSGFSRYDVLSSGRAIKARYTK